jgi:hypothetical protein
MKRSTKLLILGGIILFVGWLIYLKTPKDIFFTLRRLYRVYIPCPKGYVKVYTMFSAYCASDSQKPCKSHDECPKDERCISEDGKNWFCSGRPGCYHRNPENPDKVTCVIVD